MTEEEYGEMIEQFGGVIVQASREWQTIIPNVDKGKIITIHAEGNWRTHYARDTDLGPNGGRQTRPGDPNYIMPSENEGALIGREGESGAPFLIGANRTFTAAKTGSIYACMNDIKGAFADNSGLMTLEIGIRS